MNIISVIKRLDFKQFFRIALIVLQKPLYILPTIKATKQTLKICNSVYGKSHHLDGAANAYRHALWNILICQKIYQRTKDIERSKNWAKTITDLHEKLAPNESLEKAMDLHNNNLGRKYFEELQTASEDVIKSFLMVRIKNAKKVSDVSTVNTSNANLVFL